MSLATPFCLPRPIAWRRGVCRPRWLTGRGSAQPMRGKTGSGGWGCTAIGWENCGQTVNKHQSTRDERLLILATCSCSIRLTLCCTMWPNLNVYFLPPTWRPGCDVRGCIFADGKVVCPLDDVVPWQDEWTCSDVKLWAGLTDMTGVGTTRLLVEVWQGEELELDDWVLSVIR